MSGDTTQQFIVSPRSDSLLAGDMRERLQTLLAGIDGVSITDLDPRSRLAVLDICPDQVGTVLDRLAGEFIAEPNAPLRF